MAHKNYSASEIADLDEYAAILLKDEPYFTGKLLPSEREMIDGFGFRAFRLRKAWMKLMCSVFGHTAGRPHIDYIYGSLPREHVSCAREGCAYTMKFEKPSQAREIELCNAGDVRDGATSGCKPMEYRLMPIRQS